MVGTCIWRTLPTRAAQGVPQRRLRVVRDRCRSGQHGVGPEGESSTWASIESLGATIWSPHRTGVSIGERCPGSIAHRRTTRGRRQFDEASPGAGEPALPLRGSPVDADPTRGTRSRSSRPPPSWSDPWFASGARADATEADRPIERSSRATAWAICRQAEQAALWSNRRCALRRIGPCEQRPSLGRTHRAVRRPLRRPSRLSGRRSHPQVTGGSLVRTRPLTPALRHRSPWAGGSSCVRLLAFLRSGGVRGDRGDVAVHCGVDAVNVACDGQVELKTSHECEEPSCDVAGLIG